MLTVAVFLPNERDQCVRAFLVVRIFVRELLFHELIFRADAPEEEWGEDDEKN